MKRFLIEEDPSNDSTSGVRLKTITSKVVLNVIYPVCIIFPTISIIAACWIKGFHHFYTWHVLLTGLGFHLLMPLGISVLCGQHFPRYAPCITSRRTIHWMLQIVASVCVLAGTVLQYINREMKHKHHIVSVHSIVGLISVVLVVASLVSGVVALFGRELRQYLESLWLYRTHRSVGVVAFLAGMLALVLAYDHHIIRDSFCTEIRFAILVTTITTTLITTFGTFKKLYKSMCESFTVR